MARSGLGARLSVVAATTALAAGCVVARPVTPRVAASPTTSVRLDHFRRDTVAVAVKGGAPVGGAWLAKGETATCGAGDAATKIGPEQHGVENNDPSERLVELEFANMVVHNHFTTPSTLAIALATQPPTCLTLPLSGLDPSLAWHIGGAGGPINGGMRLGTFLPLTGRDDGGHGAGIEWDLVTIGKWVGPVRPTLGVGFAGTSRMGSIHTAGTLVAYPWVFGRLGLGVAAGYELLPSWGHDFADGDSFKWVHGPRVEVHVVAIGERLLGLPPPERLWQYGLSLWLSRLDADHFGTTVLGISLLKD